MIQRYLDFLGTEETLQLLEANERVLNPTIRVNTLKISPNELKKRLEDLGFKLASIKNLIEGFKVLEEPKNIGSLHEYQQGYYYLQNEASMMASKILEPGPNQLIIDMCAAPGGKSTHIAQLMKNSGVLILIEKKMRRIPALDYNLRRLGIQNSIILNIDALNLKALHFKADKILLDAPCTGEGLIREDPSRKKSRYEEDLVKMSQIQKSLLERGLGKLKNNGILLYCTCSIAPEENELVVDAVLKKKRNFSIIKSPIDFGTPGYTTVYKKELDHSLKDSIRLFPHAHDSIGFYYCLIQRNS